MSATMTLRNSMARRNDATVNFIQHSLMIAGFLLVLGVINFLTKDEPLLEAPAIFPTEYSVYPVTREVALSEPVDVTPAPAEPAAPILSPRMQGALNYVTRRYQVSPESLMPIFEVVQMIGKERRVDPLLIVAIIGIESRFNPFAKSPMGAQGLMQIIPRYHLDKVPQGAGDQPFLDPITNVKVGVQVLEEAIRRRGGLAAGLQSYSGSSEAEGFYSDKVLAEKERLEQAARRNLGTTSPNA